MSTFLTISEYAKKIKKCSPQAVRRAIKYNNKKLLPKVIDFKKYGRDWLIEIS